MSDLNDDNFDQMMRDHFAQELDGQLRGAPRVIHRVRRWPLALAGGAAIAAALVGWMLLRPEPAKTAPTIAVAEPAVKYEVAWETVDHGTVFLDDETPMQAYVYRQIATARWVDPATNAVTEVSVPHEKVVLIGLNTY